MRDLVYLSQAKLTQLRPTLGGRGRWSRDVDAEVKTPLGGLKVGRAAQPPEPHVEAVVARLEAAEPGPLWYPDPAVRPGRWVHFEAELSYAEVSDSVVFLAAGESPRLLLHGSAEHLVGQPPTSPGRGGNLLASHWYRFRQLLDAEPDEMPGHWPARVLSMLEELLQPRFTAEWMAGYARVTAKFPASDGGPELLAASPLYVERVAPPEG
ncbi:SAVMC3_10250 family protein [Amycolatopsis dongchuanensis]|uniref:Uncharacterized protein n=1 Tax=Amycolatopsis dongchuanensis TaxID=1070866 RepID=A0ABP9PSG1_9PSEU